MNIKEDFVCNVYSMLVRPAKSPLQVVRAGNTTRSGRERGVRSFYLIMAWMSCSAFTPESVPDAFAAMPTAEA